MSLNFFSRPITGYLLVASVLFASPADAAHSISALGVLADGLWYLSLGLVGFCLFIALLLAHLSRDKEQKGVPVYVWVLLTLFTLLSINWFTHPKLNLTTAVVIAVTLLFHFGSFYLLKNRIAAHLASLAILLIFAALLLGNPVILSFKNYVFNDDLPFAVDLRGNEIVHPIFGNALLDIRFIQTSDGALYYGQGFSGHNFRSGALFREGTTSCAKTCRGCRGGCSNFYIVRTNRKAFARPTAIIDFQGKSNFPEGERSHPFSLINIPFENEIVNPYSKWRIGTLKQVRAADNQEVWNPSSQWLWSGVCGGGIRDNVAVLMIEAGADPNFSAKPKGETTFNCAVRSRSLNQITLFAKNGANPNIKSKAHRTNFPHPTAMFLAMHRYMELEDKVEIFNLLIDLDVNLNARHKDGETLLHRIVAHPYLRDRVGLTKFMLSAGVPPNITGQHGMTALHLAISRRDKLIKDSYKTEAEQQDLAELNEIIELLSL